jgi:glycosyltransferase involved in cell wall biosynthesis
MFRISYGITAHNEHEELQRFLKLLDSNIRDVDEVVIQLDTTATEEVKEVCYSFPAFSLIEFPLNNDFATFKNNLMSKCTGEYVFFIDADEMLSPEVINALPSILESNPEIDLFLLPRINIVAGLTEEHIRQWGWRVNENGWVNYPDYQTRLCKKSSKVDWRGKVHERLSSDSGYTLSSLPEGFDLIHIKSIERQEKQNQYYSKL